MLSRSVNMIRQLARNLRDLETVLINQGRVLSRDYSSCSFSDLTEAEFQIFSQWGEDGIIQYLVQNLVIEDKTFVEFGVESFVEANCRFLMQKDFWQGLVIDGSPNNIARIQQSDIYWKHSLTAIEAFISRDNIASLIDRAPFDKIGILSVDIDGVDYHVLESLTHLRPAIIIVEYNGLFGPAAKVTVPYDPKFRRSTAHHSNLYWGASISAFDHLLSGHNYAIVGGNAAGSNAFFVRQDLLNEKIRATTPAQAFRETAFADSRNADGKLSFVRGEDRLTVIADLPLIDVTSGRELSVSDLVNR